LRTGEEAVIRQAISCDICGAEKKQTNHWYVACEQAGEMRLGGWNSRMRQRPGAKHLCGQTCLHKLVDEFMARSSGAARGTSAGAESAEPAASRAEIDASLTSAAAYEENESSARIIASPGSSAIVPRPAIVAPVVPMQPRLVTEPPPQSPIPPQADDTPNYSSRRWRAEAWERERNRELRAVERHPELARRHNQL
jgi:hypothetical protein